MKKGSFPLLAALMLSACGTTHYEQPLQDQPYDQTTSARIRLFGNNGLPVAINPGQDCTSSKEPLFAYGYSVADKLNSTLGQHTRRSLGMPTSWKSEHMSYGESYSEVVIPAGAPSVVTLKMVTEQVVCVPSNRVFTPEAGKDYEAFLDRHDGRCRAVIRLLSNAEAPGQDADVASNSCAKK